MLMLHYKSEIAENCNNVFITWSKNQHKTFLQSSIDQAALEESHFVRLVTTLLTNDMT
jgi:hypothetical protein